MLQGIIFINRFIIIIIIIVIFRNGILAPHLPMIIPQKFDKDPYVSLSDGRMLTFFSHHDGLLHEDIKNKSKIAEKIEKEKLSRNVDIVEGSLLAEKKQKPQQSVHMFNMTFWPLTEPMEGNFNYQS